MAAIAHVVVDLLTKNELTSEDKFALLITDVPYNMAVGQPPLKPARTENVLVDKEVAGVDWLHTSCGSWRVKNQTLRLFRPTTANGWINRQLSQLEFKTGVDGEGYIMKTKYFHHSNYVKVKRTTTEMVKISGDQKQENTTFALIQYYFPDEVTSISPKKKKRRIEYSSSSNIECSSGISDREQLNNNSKTCSVIDSIETTAEASTHLSEIYFQGEEEIYFDNSVINVTEIHTDRGIEFPKFELSGLATIYKGSWENADVIIHKDLVRDHPLSRNISIVGSLTSEKFHNVRLQKDCAFQCDCDGFKYKNICAHVIAVAYRKQILEQFLVNFEFPKLKQGISNFNESAGKKPGFKSRKRQTNHEREVVQTQETISYEEEKYYVVFIKDTQAMKCYGCTGNLRGVGKETAPPPFDITLRTKTFRHYREKATNKNPGVLHIKKQKENVYFHPQLACLDIGKREFLNRLVIDEDTKVRIQTSHKKLLFSEFGYN